jgi:hypothetical protein
LDKIKKEVEKSLVVLYNTFVYCFFNGGFIMIDWSTILSNKTRVKAVKKFAVGETSGRELASNFANTEGSGEVRNLLRSHGVTYGRRLARKALKRRGY